MSVSPTVLVLALLSLVAVGCGTSSSPPTSSSSSQLQQQCVELTETVQNYDTGKSVRSEGYLALLHALQIRCPEAAKAAGLADSSLKLCERLDQHNCTAYHDPKIDETAIP